MSARRLPPSRRKSGAGLGSSAPRPGCRPMPAPARPRCWSSACCGCCSPGSGLNRILCLTYTKTAAAEMQNRLLKELADWATVHGRRLDASELTALMGQRARGRGARASRGGCSRQALEARGGLKIHTIHGFCERLLQRFPLESQVTPHFSVLDEREQALMRRAAFDAAVARAAEDKRRARSARRWPSHRAHRRRYFREVIDAVLGKRAELARMVAYHRRRDDWAEAEGLRAQAAVRRGRGRRRGADRGACARLLDDDEIEAAIAALRRLRLGREDRQRGRSRSARGASERGRSRAAALVAALFLTREGEPRAQICSKGVRQAAPADRRQALRAAQDRSSPRSTDKLAHLRLAEASAAVLALADAVQTDYERRKRAEAALDYDDLIVKTQNLLSRADAAAWVLYKIDGGIDHILVDEAQDTNPAQWAIIEAWRRSSSPAAARASRLRTLFAVGDEKQSIYSFQGADPARFARSGPRLQATGRGDRARLARGAAQSLVPLDRADPRSRRSRVRQAACRRRADLAGGRDHPAPRFPRGRGRTGRAVGGARPRRSRLSRMPFEPWNEELAGARSVDALCKRIAATIKGWIDTETLPAQGRKVRAGDILILVRRREPFTAPMIRELKRSVCRWRAPTA